VTDTSLQHHDIERIYRDVINLHGLDVSLLRIDRTVTGWRLTAKDRADRLVRVDVPDGPAAAVRAALNRWTADQDFPDSSVARSGGR
jgi:hypothetical protein